MASSVLLFALAIAIVSVTQCQAGYEVVTEGTECQRIQSKADCEAAVTGLEIAIGLTAIEETAIGWPPYCYLYQGRYLYFNKQTDSDQPCDSFNMVCICRTRDPEPGKISCLCLPVLPGYTWILPNNIFQTLFAGAVLYL